MNNNVSEELARLAKLKEDGVLTEAEFEKRKAKLLATDAGPADKSHMLRNMGIGCLGVIVLLGVIGTFAGSGGKNPPLPTASGGAAETSAPASAPGVTMAQYNRLENGMSYAEASEILGSPGTEMSSSDLGGIKTTMYMWEGTSPGANMNAMFQNGKLIQKSQFGLN